MTDDERSEALGVLRAHVGDVRVLDITRPKGGWANLSYRVRTSAGTFIVTRCDYTSADEIRAMASLLAHLEGAGVPGPRLVPHRDGRLVSEWGDRPALVKRYIEGAIPRGGVQNEPADFGRAAGRLHAATADFPITRPHDFGKTRFRRAASLAATDPFSAWLGVMLARLEDTIDPALPSGLVHGDLVLDNMVRSPDGSLTIIDFETRCREALVFDLGMLVFALADADGWSVEMQRGVVQGYEQIRPLAPAERAAIPLFVTYAATAIAFVRFQELRLDGGDRVQEGAWLAPQRFASEAWARFAG